MYQKTCTKRANGHGGEQLSNQQPTSLEDLMECINFFKFPMCQLFNIIGLTLHCLHVHIPRLRFALRAAGVRRFRWRPCGRQFPRGNEQRERSDQTVCKNHRNVNMEPTE